MSYGSFSNPCVGVENPLVIMSGQSGARVGDSKLEALRLRETDSAG